LPCPVDCLGRSLKRIFLAYQVVDPNLVLGKQTNSRPEATTSGPNDGNFVRDDTRRINSQRRVKRRFEDNSSPWFNQSQGRFKSRGRTAGFNYCVEPADIPHI